MVANKSVPPKISPSKRAFEKYKPQGLIFGVGVIFGGAYLPREICVSKSIELAL